MRRITAELVHRLTDLQPGRDLAPIGLGAMNRYTRSTDGQAGALDEQLRVTRRRDVTPDRRLLAASPDLSTVVLGGFEHMVVHLHDRTVKVAIEHADTATLVSTTRMVVTAPAVTYGDGHHVRLVDLPSAAVLDTVTLDLTDALLFTAPHPSDGSIVLNADLGQDGSKNFVVHTADTHLTVTPMRSDVTISGFNPSGAHLLLLPHPASENQATVLDWPAQRPAGHLKGADLGFTEYGIDMYGCYLSNDQILLLTEGGLLLCDAGLAPIAWLDLPTTDDDTQVASVLGLGPHLFAAEVWANRAKTAAVWRTPATHP
ncbi:hypothetical protein KOI35_43865 [Actinoplanes bogorensis]|uniref:Uncharacterized protein n=1 Tax=Paractinoplanes bogorensis TaxID=1610840 RepID=A0ABS5Z504_9ACTN|nr:hypothetical protein [Actinoplanes bogorensis]MBU2670461.1 hypothetical protein [Actinoplanes bogorensis]